MVAPSVTTPEPGRCRQAVAARIRRRPAFRVGDCQGRQDSVYTPLECSLGLWKLPVHVVMVVGQGQVRDLGDARALTPTAVSPPGRENTTRTRLTCFARPVLQ